MGMRTCKRCGNIFKSTAKHPSGCDKCKRSNVRNLLKHSESLEKQIQRRRQSITTTIEELRQLADSLEKEAKSSNLFTYDKVEITKLKWSVVILNDEPKCSDTWYFER